MRGFKAYVAGILTGLMVLSVPIYAGTVWDKITVIKDGIAIKVDGQAVNTPNFLYEDTTYVPLRIIAQMLGQNVTWVESENTAYIGRVPAEKIEDVTTIARVNGVPITATEFVAFTYNSADSDVYLSDLPLTENMKKSILDELVLVEAVNQYAKVQGFELDPNDLEAFTAEMDMQRQHEESMLENNMSFATYERLSINFHKYFSYLESIFDTFATDSQIKQYYDENKEKFQHGEISFEDAKEQIRQELAYNNMQLFTNQIKSKADVEILNDELNDIIIQ